MVDAKKVIENLKAVKKALDEEHVFYFIDGGALLGAVRTGHLIPWDFDIDIATFDTEREKVERVIKKLEERGYKLGKETHIEICFYHLEGDKAVEILYMPNKTLIRQFLDYLHNIISLGEDTIHISKVPRSISRLLISILNLLPSHIRKTLDHGVLKIYKIFEKSGAEYVRLEAPAKYFKNFENVVLEGIEFLAPSPVEKYLEEKYGKDWRVPNKNFYTPRDSPFIKDRRSRQS